MVYFKVGAYLQTEMASPYLPNSLQNFRISEKSENLGALIPKRKLLMWTH